MLGRTHTATGVLAGAAVASALNMPPKVAVGFTALTGFAALLPDMDHPNASLPRRFGLLGRAVAAVISTVFGHRGLTHSLLGVGLLIVGLAFLPAVTDVPLWVSGAVVLGCLVHIAGDSLTVSGVPLLWPSDQKYGPRLFRTGSNLERFLVHPLVFALTGVVIANHLGVVHLPV